MIGKATLQYLDKSLEQDLKAELRAQGHYLTGELERSVTSKLIESKKDVSLEVVAADYINQLETGLLPDEIVFNEAYTSGILRYVQLRFHVVGEEAIKIANKIIGAHAREGMPTSGSYKFSETGERTHVLEETYTRHEDFYDQVVEDSLGYEIDNLIDETFTITDL
jgi:hypothetical protein